MKRHLSIAAICLSVFFVSSANAQAGIFDFLDGGEASPLDIIAAPIRIVGNVVEGTLNAPRVQPSDNIVQDVVDFYMEVHPGPQLARELGILPELETYRYTNQP